MISPSTGWSLLALLLVAAVLGAASAAVSPPTLGGLGGRDQEHFIDIGTPGDEGAIGAGIYQREGPNPQSKMPIARESTFRWFGNRWVLRIPVFAGRHNEVCIRAFLPRALRVQVGDYEKILLGAGDLKHEYRLALPAEVIGDRKMVELQGEAVTPYVPPKGKGDARELALMVDWIRVRPLDALPAEDDGQTLPDDAVGANPVFALPLAFRLRGTEARPLHTDLDAYVFQARMMRCNVMTIGPMNGQHFTAFATKEGIPHENMHPEFIREQVKALHAHGIAAIGWLPFNVQDLRRVEDCQAAAKYPDYRMEYIDWPERPATNRVGMCVVSSPWRRIHAGILKEAAAQGIDGVFFDGFYLGGIPHPSVPGCVCKWCREAFKKETGLETPSKVDWTDPTFKRWVRWRNHKLIEVATDFRDAMRQANPRLDVTCNYNIWPFADKGWETAIPMWATDAFGVSQHAYSGREDLEWVMLGFKSRVSHDLNPKHSDIWRTSSPAWKFDGSEADIARHELTMRTFMLSALSHGTTPWHGGHIQPMEVGIRVHEAVRAREAYFSQEELRHVGVLLSQNTHDFWGYQPGTTHKADYQDAILGTWLLLTESHVPFRFVFDNQVEAGALGDTRVLLLPNAACLSDAMAAKLKAFAAGGGRIIATAETGACDEWGNRRAKNALEGVRGLVRLEEEPALSWLRTRDEAAGRKLLDAVRAVPAPLSVEAPKSLVTSAMWAPGRKALWVHLLNVSAFYPAGDTGFRGLGEKPEYQADTASDGDIRLGGKIRRVNVPARNVVVRAPGLGVKSARLAVAGRELKPDANGRTIIPEVDIHDVLVLER